MCSLCYWTSQLAVVFEVRPEAVTVSVNDESTQKRYTVFEIPVFRFTSMIFLNWDNEALVIRSI